MAAVATAPGRGAIAIVRASGPGVRSFFGRVIRRRAASRARVATTVRILDGAGATIDDGLAIFFPAPHSYTGEDVLELHVHGSPAVAAGTLGALLAAGARLAGPGEFTKRAFLAGKVDLAEAEAIGALVASEHRSAARAAAAGLAGGLTREVENAHAAIAELLDALAASLDFPDEVEAPAARDLEARVNALGARLHALRDDWERGRVVRDGVAVAIVGAPNAGKSSLFNALLAQDRALVSEIAGTTRDTLEETAMLPGGIAARLIDTAGMRTVDNGESGAQLEMAGIARSHAALTEASVALVVVDASAPLSPEALNVLERTRDTTRVILFNKADLGRAAFDERSPSESEALLGSALDPSSVARIARALAETALAGDTPDLTRPQLASARQADAALAAERSLAFAAETLARGDPADLIVTDLMNAAAALDDLLGRNATEAMLERIFATFCIGK
ncbi:MAG: tRNA uridine-5-carboxymethylaminomethyl(34) synthesis GTPase MnmE [Candidatus Baltobacteraceae bacterium]